MRQGSTSDSEKSRGKITVALQLFKLEKLKVKAYEKKTRQWPFKTFTAMFNPSSFQQSYEIVWDKKQGFDSSGKEARYSRSKPERLDLTLLLDGTGVDRMGVTSLTGARAVKDRVKDFLDTAFRYNGTIHEPNFLVVEWGSLIFACRLESADITYTSFNRDGTPLRAELRVAFIADKEAVRLAKEENRQSSDLTHSRMVRVGDTLPLLTSEIYGSAAYYLDVARFNGIDDFRRLTTGQHLVFPPLESLLNLN
jgi:hypothetical protein